MANVELPPQIASISGAVGKRTNYDGSVTVTYFKTRNGKTRVYTTTYFPRKPTEKERAKQIQFGKASAEASKIVKQKGDPNVLRIWEDKYQHYLAHVSPKDLEKKRYKTFRGFIISELLSTCN